MAQVAPRALVQALGTTQGQLVDPAGTPISPARLMAPNLQVMVPGGSSATLGATRVALETSLTQQILQEAPASLHPTAVTPAGAALHAAHSAAASLQLAADVLVTWDDGTTSTLALAIGPVSADMNLEGTTLGALVAGALAQALVAQAGLTQEAAEAWVAAHLDQVTAVVQGGLRISLVGLEGQLEPGTFLASVTPNLFQAVQLAAGDLTTATVSDFVEGLRAAPPDLTIQQALETRLNREAILSNLQGMLRLAANRGERTIAEIQRRFPLKVFLEMQQNQVYFWSMITHVNPLSLLNAADMSLNWDHQVVSNYLANVEGQWFQLLALSDVDIAITIANNIFFESSITDLETQQAISTFIEMRAELARFQSIMNQHGFSLAGIVFTNDPHTLAKVEQVRGTNNYFLKISYDLATFLETDFLEGFTTQELWQYSQSVRQYGLNMIDYILLHEGQHLIDLDLLDTIGHSIETHLDIFRVRDSLNRVIYPLMDHVNDANALRGNDLRYVLGTENWITYMFRSETQWVACIDKPSETYRTFGVQNLLTFAFLWSIHDKYSLGTGRVNHEADFSTIYSQMPLWMQEFVHTIKVEFDSFLQTNNIETLSNAVFDVIIAYLSELQRHDAVYPPRSNI